ncbi:MAG: glycosyltransferase [Thermoplasmata archaeon]
MAGSEALKACITELYRNSTVTITDLPTVTRSFSRLLVNDLYNFSLRLNVSISTLYVHVGELMRFPSWSPGLENIRKIRDTILGEQPDIVIVTSPWVFKSVGRALKGTQIPLYCVVLDFGKYLPSGWVCNEANRCIVPTDNAMVQLIENGMDRSILKKVGIVVHPRFLKGRRKGYEKGRVLVLAGREGYSNSYHVVKSLLESQRIVRIDVLCGRNKSLRRRVQSIPDTRIHTYGFVDDILPFYGACQIVISKAGSFTVAECIALEKPLLVDATHGIMRQEIGNALLVRDEQIGMVIDDVHEIVEQAELLIDHSEVYASILENIRNAKGMLDPYGVVREILEEGRA